MKKIFTDTISILTQKERRRFFLSVLFSSVVSIGDILSLAFLFYIIGFYTSATGSTGISFLPVAAIQKNQLLPVSLLLLAFALKSLGGYRLYQYQYRLISRVVSRVSAAKLKQHLYGSYQGHINTDSSILVRKILHQPIEFGNYILAGFQQMIMEGILILLSIIALIIYDVKLLLSVSFVMVPAIAIITYINKKRLAGIRANIKQVNETTLQYLNESLAGFIESNVYGRNGVFTKRYSRVQSQLNNYIADIQVTQGLPSRFFELFAVLGISMLIISTLLLNGGHAETGIFKMGAFIAAAYKIIPGISRIINQRSMIKNYGYVIKDLSGILMDEQTVNTITKTIHRIDLKNVSFSYKDKQVLSHFCAGIKTGSLTGIKGDSGKGKTTIVNLILGFLNPENGDILFNDSITTGDERKQWQNRIAYVKQQSLILHESILDNIVLFEEKYNGDKLNQVIEVAGLTAFVKGFSERLNHIISEDGKDISGGQRQRIAIARALYKDADLIILDEPFNELDELSETKMLHHFRQLADDGKMIILITHNSSSLAYCDTIINLNER